eukprot:1118287-Lingulodinium_polyedra.AAC.1
MRDVAQQAFWHETQIWAKRMKTSVPVEVAKPIGQDSADLQTNIIIAARGHPGRACKEEAGRIRRVGVVL